MKAAAHTATGDAAKRRHRIGFIVLAKMIAARDLRYDELSRKDRQRLAFMLSAMRADQKVMIALEGAAVALDRLERTAGLR